MCRIVSSILMETSVHPNKTSFRKLFVIVSAPHLYISCYFHKVPPPTPPYSKPYPSFTLRLYSSCACCSNSLPFPLLFLHLACHALPFNHHNLLLTPSYITLPSLRRFSRPLDSFFCHLPPPSSPLLTLFSAHHSLAFCSSQR